MQLEQTECMRNIMICLVIVCTLISCKNSNDQKYRSNATTDDQLPFTKEHFKGTWASTNDKTTAAFKIDETSFHFNENGTFKPFPYEIKGDSFIVTYPNLRFGYKVILWKADSVHLMDEYQTNSFVRIND